jgi:GTP pyrophosphokinase
LDLGRAILTRAFRQEGYELTDKALEGVLKIFKAATPDDLMAIVGEGIHTGNEVVAAVYPELKTKPVLVDGIPAIKRKTNKDKVSGVPIKGLISGMAVHFAGCCHPLPGDRIVGIVATGKGVTIHTIDCENLEQYADTPERWLDLSWDDTEGEAHVGRVYLLVVNEPGILVAITTVIAKNMGNITNLKITNRTQEFFDLIIDIEVRDVKHLTNIIAALRATPSINSVERAKS